MNKRFIFFGLLLIFSCCMVAQDWGLKLSSKVELRTWDLTSKENRSERLLAGAAITLYRNNSILTQGLSDFNGNFTIFVPGDGEYELTISYAGCNTKRIYINTTGVPAEIQKQNHTFSIQGFIMSKPFPGIDYSLLQQYLAKIAYVPKEKGFNDNKVHTAAGLDIVSKISESEDQLIKTFCENNRSGDEAMGKGDCVLAKKFYQNAVSLMPAEKYPLQQIEKAQACVKEKEEAERLAMEVGRKTEIEEKYIQDIKDGDHGFNKKEWETARAFYQEALTIKPGEPYPTMKLAEIDKMLAQKDDKFNEALLKIKYEYALKMADVFFTKKLWEDAEDAYYEALSFSPNEKYPKEQLVNLSRILAREYAGNDKKFQESIAKTSNLNDQSYAQAIKKVYENAIIYEGDAAYLKRKAEEAIAAKNKEKVRALLEKYPPGVTEEIINGEGVVIVKRVLVKDSDVWVYQKKIFNWGGISCFRDDSTITEGIFEYETKL